MFTTVRGYRWDRNRAYYVSGFSVAPPPVGYDDAYLPVIILSSDRRNHPVAIAERLVIVMKTHG